MSRASIVIWAILIGLLVSLVAVACGGGAEPTATPTTAVVVKTPTPTATLPPGVTPSPTLVPPTPTPTKVVVAVTPTPGPSAKRGGTILFNTSTSLAASYDVYLHGHSGLITNGPAIVYSSLLRKQSGPDLPVSDVRIVCDLCTSWTQPDAVTFIFNLRKGVIFSKSIGSELSTFPGVNGREMTADDVVWSLKHQQCDVCTNRYIVADAKEITALDKYTVKIVLNKPDADWLEAAATNKQSVTAREIADAKGDYKQGPSIGTGPWILVAGDRTLGHTYVRNPDYYILGSDGKPLPYLDGMRQLPVRDLATQFAAFRTGQIKWFGLTGPNYKVIVKDYPSWTYQFIKGTGSSYGIHLKVNTPPFDNEDFRRAIFYAYNPYDQIATAWDGLGWFMGGFEMPLAWGEELAPQMKQYVGDIAKAREYLAKSGVQTPISFKFWIANYGETAVSGAQVVPDMLKAIGINLTIELHDASEYQATYPTGNWNFQMGFGPYGRFAVNSFLNEHYRCSGLRAKAHGMCDPEIDRLIDLQWGELDPAKRKAVLFQFAHYVAQKGWWDAATSSVSIRGIRPELHDLYIPYDSYDMRYLADIWLDPQ